MKIKCLHGFFILEETTVGQISDFISLTGLELVPYEDAFTFAALENAPDFSLVGADLLGIPATKTFAGKPWEVFKANGFAYDFDTGLLRPIASTTAVAKIDATGNRFMSPGLLMPGSLTDDGERVKDYSAWYLPKRQRWLYSEVTFV